MKRNFRLLITLVGLSFVALFLTSCEEGDDVKIAQAQSCLDKAMDGSDAALCIEMVDGVDTAKASLIRCGGTYLQQGFTTAKFTSAYNKLKNPGTGVNPMMGMISNIAFTATNTYTRRTNTADAVYVTSECAKSGSTGLAWLANSTKLATTIYAIGGATAGDPASFLTVLGTANSTQLTTIGTAAREAYAAQCANTSQSTTSSCRDFSTAVTACSTDLCIGQQLQTLLGRQ